MFFSMRATLPMTKNVAQGTSMTTPSQETIFPVPERSMCFVAASIRHHEIADRTMTRPAMPLITFPVTVLRKSMYAYCTVCRPHPRYKRHGFLSRVGQTVGLGRVALTAGLGAGMLVAARQGY